MPTYAHTCDDGHEFDLYLKLAQLDEPQFCTCGRPAQRMICAPMIFVQPDVCYDSPIDGRPITTRKARIEDMKRNGCIEYDPEMKKDAERHRNEADAKLDSEIETTVEREIHQLPSRKREALSAEIQGGLTAEAVRMSPQGA